jgi:hypothetical protein
VGLWYAKMERPAIVSGLRGTDVRVEKWLDQSLAVRYGEKYLLVKRCVPAKKKAASSVSFLFSAESLVGVAECLKMYWNVTLLGERNCLAFGKVDMLPAESPCID